VIAAPLYLLDERKGLFRKLKHPQPKHKPAERALESFGRCVRAQMRAGERTGRGCRGDCENQAPRDDRVRELTGETRSRLLHDHECGCPNRAVSAEATEETKRRNDEKPTARAHQTSQAPDGGSNQDGARPRESALRLWPMTPPKRKTRRSDHHARKCHEQHVAR